MTGFGLIASWVIAVMVMMSSAASADEPAPPDPAPTSPPDAATPGPDPQTTEPALDAAVVARLRDLYDNHDYAGVRRELLAAYHTTPHPSLLFALGQVELAIEHYQAAIDYYERFITTKPPQDQIDLAQQAIGAARIQLATQKPRRHRTWHGTDTAVVIAGGLAVLGGTGLFVESRRLANDHGGSLTDYDQRIDRARLFQISAAGLGATGVLTIGVALLRWRLRPEDGYEVGVTASASGGSILVSRRW